MVQALVDKMGAEEFLRANITGIVSKLVAAFKHYYKYEKEGINLGGTQTQETDETGLRGRFVRGGSPELSGTPETGGKAKGWSTEGRGESGVRFSVGDGTVDAHNREVNMTGPTFNIGGREVKPRITRYNFQEAFQDAILSVKKNGPIAAKAFGSIVLAIVGILLLNSKRRKQYNEQ